MIKNKLLELFGWSIIGIENLKPRSILVVAPHTSCWDGFWGLLGLWKIGHSFITLGAGWLFKVPVLGWIMGNWFNGIPVGSGPRALIGAIKGLRDPKVQHLVICPEGTRSAIDRWPQGWLVISKKAGVPVDICVIDYHSKALRILENTETEPDLRKLYTPWKDVAKYPEKFVLPINNHKLI